MSTEAKERPILMSAPMVRAILEGRKTQTRRIVKPQPPKGYRAGYESHDSNTNVTSFGLGPSPFPDPRKIEAGREDCRRVHWFTCPYGQPGDRLWVKEPLRREIIQAVYAADGKAVRHPDDESSGVLWKWKRAVQVSIHMPRWASRITLEVVSVRVERLNDISEADAIAEGLQRLPASGRYVVNKGDQYLGLAHSGPRETYEHLWESLNGRGSWAANPWVWVVEFRRVEA